MKVFRVKRQPLTVQHHRDSHTVQKPGPRCTNTRSIQYDEQHQRHQQQQLHSHHRQHDVLVLAPTRTVEHVERL